MFDLAAADSIILCHMQKARIEELEAELSSLATENLYLQAQLDAIGDILDSAAEAE